MFCSARVRISIGILLSAVLLLGGCQSESGEETAKHQNSPAESEKTAEYRSSFTEVEKTEGEASFELTENVRVNARLTPVERYNKGLKKYHLAIYYEEGESEAREDFLKDPHIYGKKLADVRRLVEEATAVSFTGKGKMDDEEGADTMFLTQKLEKDDRTYQFKACWFKDREDSNETDAKLNCPFIYIENDSEGNGHYGAYTIDEYYRINGADTDPTIGDPDDATGQRMKEFLEDLLGRKLSDTWRCIPVTGEIVAELDQDMKDNIGELETDYHTYWFYADVDGLPFMNLELLYKLKEGETACAALRRTASSDLATTFSALSEHVQSVSVSEDGTVINMELSRMRMEGDVYRDTAEVTDPDVILGKLKEYYDRQLITSEITVTEVSLVYTGYFTDGSEGEIRPTVAPFWLVTAYGGKNGRVQFVYDAFTGEAVREGVSA